MAALHAENVWHHPHQLQVGNLKQDTYTLPKEPWAALFGEAQGTNTGSPYDVQSTTTWSMPQAFQGVREMIGQQIERIVFHEGNWHMRVVMPFQKVGDANEVVWNTTEFDGHLASPTPELGVVRLVQSKRIQNTASFTRKGIGYYMEHGFMNTRQGIEYHMEHLRQMAQAALETSKFDVVYTLFQYQTVNRDWELKFGRYKRKKVEDVVSERVWMFACLQKYKRALKVLDIRVNEIMLQYGGRADTWIVPPAVINYFSVAKEEYLSYSIAGPRGPDIAFDSPKPLFPLMNGSQVFVSRTYHTSEMTGHEDILSKRSEIGEFYLFEDRHTDDHTGYRTKWRHIRIYNEDANQWFEITPKYVLDHSHLFKADGSPRYADENMIYQHYVEHKDGLRDIWEYENDHRMHKTELFGEMALPYFTAHDTLQYADTVLAALRHDYSDAAVTEMMQDWNRGMDLVRRIEGIRFDDGAHARIWAGIVTTEPAVQNKPTGLNSVFSVKHLPVDSGTGFTKIQDGVTIDSLLPGLQSYAGLRLLVKIGSDALAKEKEIAARFLSTIDTLVDNLRKYMPNSVYTDRKYASSWWHYAKDAATFFENLVLPARVPMFLSTTAGDFQASGRGGESVKDRWVRNVLAVISAIREDGPSDKGVRGSDPDNFFDEGGLVEGVDLRRVSFVWLLAAITTRLLTESVDQTKIEETFGAELRLSPESRTQKQMINEVVELILQHERSNKGAFSLTKKQALVSTFNNFAEKFNLAYANFEKGGTAAAHTSGGYVRTTILASPTYLASLAETQQKTELLPADPDFPELVMNFERLRAATGHSAERGDLTDAERQTATAVAHRLNPAFLDREFNEHSVRGTALINHAMATQLGHTIDVQDFRGHTREDDEPLQPVAAEALQLAAEAIGDSMDQLGDRVHSKKAITTAERKVHDVLGRMLSTTFTAKFNAINAASTNSLQRAIAHTFTGTHIHREVFNRAIQHNLVFPLSAVIARPHMTYSTLCMIKCLSGPEMGMTLVKDGRFEIQDDAATHAHLGTYIYYSKAVVKNPKHVFVAQEVFCNGYLGGTGVRPINPANYQAGEGEANGESIVVIGKPYNNPVTGLFSMTGRLTLGEFEDYELSEDGRLLYDTARRYNALYGWNSARLVDDFDKGPFDGTAIHVYNSMPGCPNFFSRCALPSGPYILLEPWTLGNRDLGR